jgi:hypothetical protein
MLLGEAGLLDGAALVLRLAVNIYLALATAQDANTSAAKQFAEELDMEHPAPKGAIVVR